MNNTERAQLLQDRLNRTLAPTRMELVDDSAAHAGHASAKGGAHFNLTIVSDAFRGKTLVQRHRMVYDAAGDLMHREVHALGIKASAPDEA